MTRFLSTRDLKALCSRHGVAGLLGRLSTVLQDDYQRWHEFDKCPRLACHSDVGVIELMPIADQSLYAFKYVNGHPGNATRGLPTVMALGVLADTSTGTPILLSELTITTALRTAANSALVARHCARKNARSMALIGNGAQSEFQAIAFHEIVGITEIRAYDIDADASRRLIHNLRHYPSIKIQRAESIECAMAGADIVTTVTADKTRATIITPAMVEAGMHINAVGGDCPGKTELHPDVLRNAQIIVEYEPQTRIEGDIQQLPPASPVTEFWRIICGEVAGRKDEEQITVFDSVGFAMEDFSALRLLNELACADNIGSSLDLISCPSDPKDLFGVIADASTAPLPRLLMSPPTHYDVSYKINPWMDPSAWRDDANKLSRDAQQGWLALQETYQSLGVQIELQPAQEGLPDLVFTANSAVVLNGKALLARFKHPERQGEQTHGQAVFRALCDAGQLDEIHQLPHGVYHEGAGDAVWDAHRNLFWTGYGQRSSKAAGSVVGSTFDVSVIEMELIDPRFYHLDTCLCVLSGGEVIAYLPALSESSRTTLRARAGDQLIEASEQDALVLGINSVCIGRDVVMCSCSSALKQTLQKLGYRVHVVPLGAFNRSGGAAYCLTLRLDQNSVDTAVSGAS